MTDPKSKLIEAIDEYATALGTTVGKDFAIPSPHRVEQISMLRKLLDLREELRTSNSLE